MVTMFWWMDDLNNTNIGNTKSNMALMILWPILILLYIISKKVGGKNNDKKR